MMKKIFKAMLAEGKECLKNMQPLIQLFMAAMIPGTLSFAIAKAITQDVEMAAGVANISAVFGIVLLFLYDHCKDAIEYSKKNNVSMNVAWKNTARSFYDEDDVCDDESSLIS